MTTLTFTTTSELIFEAPIDLTAPTLTTATITATDLNQNLKIYDYQVGLAGLIYIQTPAQPGTPFSCNIEELCTITIGTFDTVQTCDDVPDMDLTVYIDGATGAPGDLFPNSLSAGIVNIASNNVQLIFTPDIS